MDIRPATADDVPAIVALLATDQLGQHREHVGDGPVDDAYTRAFADIDASPNDQLVVGVEDGEVVATLQLTSNKQRTDAHRFYDRLGYVVSHEGFERDLRGDAG